MAIATRWHKPSCKTPQVAVDGNVPACQTCGSSAETLLQRATKEPAPSYSGIKLPPEAPIGQMNLWWPPCVPYTGTRNGAPRAQPGASSRDAASVAPQELDSSLSEMYRSTLGKDRFRLLYLSGARTIGSPIHGDLVEYQRENCPEYETTSYSWGGEDGDATPCKPAYFGDFWDMLFLTRNCWSLLQYLRPRTGTRTVWVDAICINQNNIEERGAQVFHMPQIYRNCMRVVIYPGDHLVRIEEDKFRQRIRHDEIMKDGHVDPVEDSRLDIWGSVLQSRYISRVWIIQELILAPHAILALKNHDLDLSNNLLYCVSQKDNRRKWLEFMGQDYKLRQTTLLEGLSKTYDSQATDPRDRIFGILGILWGNATYSEIVPDYSISMRDCVIGAMGLTLIKSKEIWPLLALHGQNSKSTSGYPSWVPNLDEIGVWTEEAPPSRGDPGSIEVPGEWGTAIGLAQTSGRCRPTRPGPGGMETQVLIVGSDMPWSQDASIDSRCGALTLRLVRMFDKPHRIVEEAERRGRNHFLVKGPSAAAWLSSKKLPQLPDQPCHVFLAFSPRDPGRDTKLETGPTALRTSSVYAVFAAEAEASGTFRLVSCCHLDDALLLSASTPPAPAPWPLLSDMRDNNSSCSVLSLFETLHQTLNHNTRQHSLHKRQYNSDVRKEFGKFYPWNHAWGCVSEAMLFDMIVPGKGAAAPGFLQLSLAAARTGEPDTVTEDFRRAYAACLQSASAEFNPVLDDEYVWFTLFDNDALSHYWDNLIKHISDVTCDVTLCGSPLDPRIRYVVKHDWQGIVQWLPWNILFPPWFDMQIPEIGRTLFDGHVCYKAMGQREEVVDFYHTLCTAHQDYEPQGHMGLSYWLPCAEQPRELQMPIRARMPLRKVVEAVRATKLNWLHRYLLAFSERVSEDVDALLERGPRPEDSNIYLHGWPKSLVDELGFVWRNELVTFV